MLLPWLLFQLSSRLHQRMLDHETVNPAALENALRVVNPTGSVGVIGVYIAPDSGAKDEQPTGDLLVPARETLIKLSAFHSRSS